MFAPIAPLFASECWSKFLTVPQRVDVDQVNLKWDKDVLEQNWPAVDENIDDILVIRVSQNQVYFVKSLKYSENYIDC